MNECQAWFTAGGPTMIALGVLALALGFLLVERYLAIGAQMRTVDARRKCPDGPAELSGLRRMGLIHACIVIAPLLGLLGTVSGVIETFESILSGGYIAEMGQGIRKALLTTQYGLAIAAPGLLAERALLRRIEKLRRLVRACRLSTGGGG